METQTKQAHEDCVSSAAYVDITNTAGEAIRRGIAEQPEVNSWALKIEFLWNRPDKVRADRIYSDFWRPSLFRAFHETPGVPDSRKLLQEFRFQSTPFGRTTSTDKPTNLARSKRRRN